MTDLFDFKPAARRFAVVGNPVKHSKSPQIHQLFAQQFEFEIEYDTIQVDAGGLQQAVSHFAARGGSGLNITIPFKGEAFALAERLSERARLAGTVNTLVFGDQCFGDNTDGIGLLRDLELNLNCVLREQNILVIGAGGAVSGVLAPLLAAEPSRLLVANRTADKATALARRFSQLGNIDGCGLDRIAALDWDLVINGTATSLKQKLPEVAAINCGRAKLAYDMMYADQPTVFMRWALANGAARAVDGLGMLVEQAAESFQLWHDKRPQTGMVISALRKR